MGRSISQRIGSEKAAARRFFRTQRPILYNRQAHVSRGSCRAHLSQLMATRPKSMSRRTIRKRHNASKARFTPGNVERFATSMLIQPRSDRAVRSPYRANLAAVTSEAIGPPVARRCVCLSRSLDSRAR